MQTYPIQTGPSAPPTTFILASELGCALNCDLTTGLDKTTGLPVTADDAPLINAALAAATADNPICLIMDGSSAVSGIKGPAGGHWSIHGLGRDTGFFVMAGSNFHCIANESAMTLVAQGPAPARLVGNVSIRDITVNGNHDANSTTGDPEGVPGVGGFFNIYLKNLSGIEIRNVYFTHSPCFNLTLDNCGDWVVDGCNFRGQTGNTDGIHVNGPSDHGYINNCNFWVGDDPIALNAWEGYGGPITQIVISNCVSTSQTHGRMYTTSTAPPGGGAQPLVDGVLWSNYHSTSQTGNGIFIGLGSGGPGSVPETIRNITFSNCKFSGAEVIGAAQISDNVGALTFDSCDFIGATGPAALISAPSGTLTVKHLSINNCRLIRSGAGVPALIDAAAGVTFSRVNVNGFQVVDAYGYSGSPLSGLLNLGSGAVGSLQIDAIDASNIAALIASGNAPASVAGAAVLQTGWPVADSAMAKWTPYVSATSGVPSYRNAAGAAVAL